MTQGPSDEWSGSERDNGAHRRPSHRMGVLTSASAAVRRAHATAAQAAEARATPEEAFRTALENRALSESEREARNEREARAELEGLVRRFAALLRADGAPPEVAVRRVKSAVDPVIFSARDPDGADVEWRRTVASDVVTWFVEAYYAA